MHFRVESALSGSSVCLVLKNADLFQYINIYLRKIPNCCVCVEFAEKVNMNLVVSRAKKLLRKESEEEGVRTPSTIPNYEVDLHVDGLEIFQNSEKPGLTSW